MNAEESSGKELRSAEMDSLLELMQDSDGVTARLVRNRMDELGWKAVRYCFLNLDRVVSPDMRAGVHRQLREMSSACCIGDLAALLAEGSSFYVPDGMYLLTRIMMPELTPEEFRNCYMEPAGDLAGELRDSMTAVEKTEMLNYIVFDRCGFQLKPDSWDGFESPVLIPELMEERRAGVVGLSAVYFLLAGTAGLPVYPVFPNVPGYYVAYFERGETLFSMDMSRCGRISDPVPRRSWMRTDFMGTDRTVLYLYATALRRFGCRTSRHVQASLLDRALDMLRL